MEKCNLLTKDEVIKTGFCFDGDTVCYGGEYGQQVCKKSAYEREEPITGIVYELYDNQNLNYYCHYIDGIPNGENVTFYESGKLKSASQMYKGVKHGKTIEWYEDGAEKSITNSKYGFVVSFTKWNDEGEVSEKQVEPKEFDRKMIEKYEKQK
jgi:antitoxin component YwqK of YwqJK toxin-antitoxin module